jgi:hypothetical protein
VLLPSALIVDAGHSGIRAVCVAHGRRLVGTASVSARGAWQVCERLAARCGLEMMDHLPPMVGPLASPAPATAAGREGSEVRLCLEEASASGSVFSGRGKKGGGGYSIPFLYL